MPSLYKNFPLGDIAVDTRKVEKVVDEGCACQLRNLGDDGRIIDLIMEAGSCDSDSELRDEFVVEDVVVGCVSNGSTNDTDSECQSCDRGNQVVWTDDRRDNRGGNNDSTDAKTGDDKNTVDCVEIIDSCSSKSTAASSHHDRRADHKSSVASTEYRKKPENNASAYENGESNGHAANSDTNGVMAIDVEGLRRPEQEDGEEVGTGDESDNKGQG